jgi:mannose PTS system EIIA component
MIGLILVTHGTLANEFVVAMEHVVGPQKQIATVCIGPRDDMEQRRKEIAQAIKSVDDGRHRTSRSHCSMRVGSR